VGRVEVELGVHVERELAVGVDMRPEERRERTAVGVDEPGRPGGLGEDALQERRVDVDER
jgi:hypothetical protein